MLHNNKNSSSSHKNNNNVSPQALRLLEWAASHHEQRRKKQIEGVLWILRHRNEIRGRHTRRRHSAPIRKQICLPALLSNDDEEDYIIKSNNKIRGIAETVRAGRNNINSTFITKSSYEDGYLSNSPTTTGCGGVSSCASPVSAEEAASSDVFGNRWYMRTTSIRRRYTGLPSDWDAAFKKRTADVRARFGRRRSFTERAIAQAEHQCQQFAFLSERQALQRSSCRSVSYRRSVSEASLNQVHAALERIAPGVSSCPRVSRHSDRYKAVEVWPESVTGLLTGEQLVVDRVLLMSQVPTGVALLRGRDGSPLTLQAAGVALARPDKKVGEDSFFVCEESCALGVADGVGEWADFGCNAKLFAEELMIGATKAAQSLQRNNKDLNKRPSAKALQCIIDAYSSTRSYGSSTCLVGVLDGAKWQLGLANLGDSTALVLRREAGDLKVFMTLRRTRSQQHFFNCPYQLSKFPEPGDTSRLEKQGLGGLAKILNGLDSRVESDTPEMADLYDIKVQPGDLVILGTDGIFDNLFDQEISGLVSLAISPAEAAILDPLLKSAKTSIPCHPNAVVPPNLYPTTATSAKNVAKALAAAAFHRSQDPRARTPFGRQSKRAGTFLTGGKLDDITVVAAWVV